MKLTDDEKDNLSPEELAAIEGDDDSTSELEEVANLNEGEEGGEEGEEEGEATEAKPPIEGAEGKEKAAEKTGDEETAADKDKPSAETTDKPDAESAAEETESAPADFTPRLVAEDVTKINDKLAELAQQKVALDEEFDNGDLKHSEYMAKRDALSTQETDLRVQLKQSEFASKQNQSTGEQRWLWEQDRFFEDHEIYQVGSDSFDPLMHAALDAAVKGLASAKDDAGKLVNDGRSLKWYLEEGHRQVSSRFKLAEVEKPKDEKKVAEKDDKDAKGKGGKETRAGKKPDLTGIPKTIGNLPAAEGNEAADSEFAAIDKLEGMEYEEALARMTPEQQERYSKAN